MSSTATLSRGTLVINVEACKGCDLCIDACKPGVLEMTVEARNERGYSYPELHPGCTACHACAVICPDFVFQVWRSDEPLIHDLDADNRTKSGEEDRKSTRLNS